MLGPIGMQELIIIFVIALIVFGPRKLPQLGKSLGRSIAEFKRASNELKSTLEQEIRVEETRKEIMEPIETLSNEAKQAVKKATDLSALEDDVDSATATEPEPEPAAEKSADAAVDGAAETTASTEPKPAPPADEEAASGAEPPVEAHETKA